MSRGPIHICFYSNHCPLSQAFISEISTTPYKQEFKYICADPSPTRPKLPNSLKTVPTLYLQGEGDNPRSGQDALNWLFMRKQMEGARKSTDSGIGGGGLNGGPGRPVMGSDMKNPMMSQSQQPMQYKQQQPSMQQQQQPSMQQIHSDEPEPFSILDNPANISSESYSFINQDTSAQGSGGLYQSDKNNNFSFLHGVGTKEGTNISGMDTISSVGNKSRKEAMFDQQLEAYKSQRMNQIPMGIRRQ